MAKDEHLNILQQGVAAWNQWRDQHSGITPDLTNIKFRGANFARANLSDANLSGAYLRDVNLEDADLSRAILVEADLARLKYPEQDSIQLFSLVPTSKRQT